MLSRYEKIVAFVCLGGLLTCIAAAIFIIWSIRNGLDTNLGPGIMAGGVGYASMIAGGLIFKKLSAKRLAAEKERKVKEFHEAIRLPDVSQTNTSNAILTLSWSIDLKTLIRLNTIYIFNLKAAWILMAITGVIMALIGGFAFGTANIAALALWFIGGAVMWALSKYNGIVKTITAYYPDKTAVRHTVFMIADDGLKEISGQTLKEFAWKDVKGTNEVKGTAIVNRGGELRMVPSHAFHSIEDARAFVETINAMKDGKPAPAHDWSGYRAELPGFEGVWPPAISPH